MSELKWFFYYMNPIDFKWEMLSTPAEVLGKLTDLEYGQELFSGGISHEALAFIKHYHYALEEAKKRGWEGDIRGGNLRVFWLPDDTEFAYAFVWKQDNNGDTFVASPRELPWLETLGNKI
jgi:hypothetical protein